MPLFLIWYQSLGKEFSLCSNQQVWDNLCAFFLVIFQADRVTLSSMGPLGWGNSGEKTPDSQSAWFVVMCRLSLHLQWRVWHTPGVWDPSRPSSKTDLFSLGRPRFPSHLFYCSVDFRHTFPVAFLNFPYTGGISWCFYTLSNLFNNFPAAFQPTIDKPQLVNHFWQVFQADLIVFSSGQL